MASHVNGCEAAVRQESVVAFRRFARTLVELVLRRLEQKKQAGGGDFALIVVVVNLQRRYFVLRTVAEET